MKRKRLLKQNTHKSVVLVFNLDTICSFISDEWAWVVHIQRTPLLVFRCSSSFWRTFSSLCSFLILLIIIYDLNNLTCFKFIRCMSFLLIYLKIYGFVFTNPSRLIAATQWSNWHWLYLPTTTPCTKLPAYPGLYNQLKNQPSPLPKTTEAK